MSRTKNSRALELIQKEFPIGTRVVVSKLCSRVGSHEYVETNTGSGGVYRSRRTVKKVEEESVFPFDAVVSGCRRLLEGRVVRGNEDCEGYLDVSGGVLVICVRRGLLNRELYVPVGGLYKVSDSYKDHVKIPVVHGNWSNSRSEEFRKEARIQARSQKRDSVGRFVKC